VRWYTVSKGEQSIRKLTMMNVFARMMIWGIGEVVDAEGCDLERAVV